MFWEAGGVWRGAVLNNEKEYHVSPGVLVGEGFDTKVEVGAKRTQEEESDLLRSGFRGVILGDSLEDLSALRAARARRRVGARRLLAA